MFTMMAQNNILLSDIILVLVLVILVLGENSVFGHAKGRKEIAAVRRAAPQADKTTNR